MSFYDDLMNTGHWGPVEAALAVEFACRCAYCDKPMLETVDAYKEWQTDHIIPVCQGGGDTLLNYVLSCRTCNFIKGRWDPAQHLAGAEATRANLIRVAREYVTAKRRETEQYLVEYRALMARHTPEASPGKA